MGDDTTSGIDDAGDDETELPDDVVAEAERLTRLARDATDDAEAYRADRAERLAEHGFTARVREEDTGETLVLHPVEWVEDGTVQVGRIEETDRAVERRLSGPGEPGEFEAVDAHNREVVAEIEARAGTIHAENAAVFADFMGNHYVRRVETATGAELREFLEWYFPRNAFPSQPQKEAIEESLRLVFAVTERDPPALLRE
jgi:hypothetical protein